MQGRGLGKQRHDLYAPFPFQHPWPTLLSPQYSSLMNVGITIAMFWAALPTD